MYSFANTWTTPSLKKSIELFIKEPKQREERVRFQSLFVSIVEFRWLELKRTVNICLSYQKFEPPNFINFRVGGGV